MESARIEPFTASHLSAAALALAARHRHHRRELPQVAPGDPGSALEALWGLSDVLGSVAIQDGRVRAFVLAQIRDDPWFGRCAWVPHAGHAGDDGELLREVYAAAAEAWVERGAERHYVLVPAFADALDPWYRLGFGHMHVEAVRPVEGLAAAAPAGVTIRRGTREDLTTAVEIDLEIYRIQARSPSFARLAANQAERRSEWLEMDLDEEGLRYLVAELNGKPVGHTLLYRPAPVLGYADDAAHLASTAVREDQRGSGIGVALVAAILRLAAEAGYGSVGTNWRMTNLSASRFWPARGFTPIYHRLQRALGNN